MKRPSFVIIVFLLVLGAISALTILSVVDTATVSETENRRLAEMPVFSAESWLSGEFASSAESFLSDHAYRRSEMLALAKRLEAGLQKDMEVKLVTQNVDMGGETPGAGTLPEREKEKKRKEAGKPAEMDAQEEEETEERIILEDRVIPVYETNEDVCRAYIDAVNAFMALFPDNVSKTNLVIPGRIAFEPEFKGYSGDQRADIGTVYSELSPLIDTVEIWGELERYDVNDLYFRTDHHWTAFGAYIGARAYLEAVGRECAPIEVYKKMTGRPFLGYLYAQTGTESLEAYRDELIYYTHPDGVNTETVYKADKENPGNILETKDAVLNEDRQGYYTFVESSYIYAVVNGRAQDQSCLLVVGDSYCNAMIPWLSDNFGKVAVIDPRYWTGGKNAVLKLFEQEKVTDVLIADYIGSLDSGWYVGRLKDMCE